MNEKFNRLPLKKYYLFSFFLSLAVICGGLLAQFILPPEIPLFYGQPQSDEQLAGPMFIILPQSIALIITFMNGYLSTFAESIYLKKVLALSAASVAVLAAVTTLKIILLVGNI